jgi:hypothetical protein
MLIDGGGTVKVARDAYYTNGAELTFYGQGTTDAIFTGSGNADQKVWFNSSILESSTNGLNNRNFNLKFVGINVELGGTSTVTLNAFTPANTTYWAGIDVYEDGNGNGGYFTVDNGANDNVTLFMDANAKPDANSPNPKSVIIAEAGLSGKGAGIFQVFTPIGNWRAWTSAQTLDGSNFLLTW